jgi:CMP-N-acetylneuraminic acid synthetase
MNKKNTVAIIPARGGSKRVPGKNIMEFCGKPMIQWTIEAAQESKLFDEIVVSTDDPLIAKVSESCGASVPFLRESKADDFSPVSEATVETLKQLKKGGKHFENVVQLFAVCPLRNAEDITKAFRFFQEQGKPFVISCFRYAWMNPWWALTLDSSHQATWIFEDAKKRSQDLPDLFCPTGAIWIANAERLLEDKTFYGKGHIFWEMDWKRAVDIDNYEDIRLAKALKMSLD